jgi:hypothetical protein
MLDAVHRHGLMKLLNLLAAEDDWTTTDYLVAGAQIILRMRAVTSNATQSKYTYSKLYAVHLNNSTRCLCSEPHARCPSAAPRRTLMA